MYKMLFAALACLSLQSVFCTDRGAELVEHTKKALLLAEEKHSSIQDPRILNIEGMSGHKVKHFLNNLCSLAHTSYLEIGCWKGSTLIAALYGNESFVDQAVAIDNWSEWGGPKNEFLKNTHDFLPQGNFELAEVDCFSLDKKAYFARPVNIYFYDGAHDALAQERAFTYFNDVFDDVFIGVVDDWNHGPTREGTRRAFDQLNYEILFEREFYTREQEETGWWNGFYFAVIKKQRSWE